MNIEESKKPTTRKSRKVEEAKKAKDRDHEKNQEPFLLEMPVILGAQYMFPDIGFHDVLVKPMMSLR